jgi:ketosteroid isomerase-like protein
MDPVALAKESFEAFLRGDVDTAIRRFDERTEIHTPPEMMNNGTFYGPEGFRNWTEQWFDAWEEYSLEPLEYEQLDDEHVIVHCRQSARGKGSGVPVEMEVFWLAQMTPERTVRLHLYPRREDAVAAAGG